MKKFDYNPNETKSFFIITLITLIITTTIATSIFALTDTTRPTILTIVPENNGLNIPTNQKIMIEFSEEMDPSSINANNMMVIQRTTPKTGDYRYVNIPGTVTYQDKIAIFTPNAPLSPSQEFGNVFTVTVTTGVKDISGNQLSQNYKWSFTTGNTPFYTSASTSQLDQTDINPISSTPQSAASPAIQLIPTTTQNPFPWAWVIGGLVILAIVVITYVILMKPTPKENIPPNQSTEFGNIHPISSVEGITEEYAKALYLIGISTTKELWDADADMISQETEIPKKLIVSWQHMAELMSVPDIGPQYAELLERSGIHTIAQLRSFDAKTLLKIIRKKQDSQDINIIGNAPGFTTIQHWIDSARDSSQAYNKHHRTH